MKKSLPSGGAGVWAGCYLFESRLETSKSARLSTAKGLGFRV